MDLTCAHCAEPWEVYGFRSEGFFYVRDNYQTESLPDHLREQADEIDEAIESWIDHSDFGDEMPTWLNDKVIRFGQKIFELTATGQGCPACGFDHRGQQGKHRNEQLRELFYDGVTDEDPIDFL